MAVRVLEERPLEPCTKTTIIAEPLAAKYSVPSVMLDVLAPPEVKKTLSGYR